MIWTWTYYPGQEAGKLPGSIQPDATDARKVERLTIFGSALGPPQGMGGDPVVALPAMAGSVVTMFDPLDVTRQTWALYRVTRVKARGNGVDIDVDFLDVQADPFAGSAARLVSVEF